MKRQASRSGRGGDWRASLAAGLAALALPSAAFAQAAPAIGRPVDTAIDLQAPGTSHMRDVYEFHVLINAIMVAIVALVLALLIWVMLRYNRKANPEPKRFSHNTLVEIVWTVVPVLILVVIAIQSFPLLYAEERAPKADLTIKVLGNSWYWSYEYPDLNVAFDSNLLGQPEAAASQKPYLLAVDEPMVVPVGATVKLLVSSNDVIHSWAIPSFGVKEDAIPGRLNEGWFKVEHPGVYYGQCSELCGVRHAYMPIEVHAVTQADFERWIAAKGGTFASAVRSSPDATAPDGQPAPSGTAAPAMPESPADPQRPEAAPGAVAPAQP